MYKTHEWILVDNVWKCCNCGSSGGPLVNYLEGKPIKNNDWMYLEGVPSYVLPISWDCDEAKKQIEEFMKRAQDNLLINL